MPQELFLPETDASEPRGQSCGPWDPGSKIAANRKKMETGEVNNGAARKTATVYILLQMVLVTTYLNHVDAIGTEIRQKVLHL